MQMKSLDNVGIGKKIQKYRKSLRMSQETLAEALCVDPTLVSRIENGRKSNLTIDLLLQIAEKLNVTLNDICYGAAGQEPDGKNGPLRADQREVSEILGKLSGPERSFLMKMIRAAAQ